MNGRAADLLATLAALPDERARLRAGVPALNELFRDVVRAAAPPNPQYERERIIAQAPVPRELVFLFGLLSEGENETALLLELVNGMYAADPRAVGDHVADEAWYYLRTSIDAQWQLDTGAPNLTAALAYLEIVLCQRLDRLRAHPPAPVDLEGEPASAALLRSLRDDFT